MVERNWFEGLPEDFEESVRIDRKEQGGDEHYHRTQAIESYHVTSDSQRFLEDFIDRLLDDAEDMRTGSTYWLYGYYGSGKSHLLTVLDGLMDTEWVRSQGDGIWTDLVSRASSGTRFDDLHAQWERVHSEYHVIPVSVNLLKYQGQKQRSFSEIVLRHAHQDPILTGVDDDISTGLSSQLDVAYFEDWYRTTEEWTNRRERAASVVDSITPSTPKYDWEQDGLWTDIQQYGALSDVVLPELFKEITGTQDGYTDLQPSDIDPEEVVQRLESLRQEREDELEKPVKLVLLLDEVSLFIGTNFERLTELQTLAENVNSIGDGEIQLVATAQAKIEDVQPKFAAHGADFSIVKDRFPHRYQLPSKHVGEIAKRRLFQKSRSGEQQIRSVLADADVKPSESLVYNELKQNTKPPLDAIDQEELVEFYPFLPYHAPLFLEILFNLRREANDPAKSIFSGTARAILALMHGLLEEWVEDGDADRIVTLVDFFDLIEPELRDTLAQDMRVVEGTEETTGIADEVQNPDSEIEAFDLAVAKAILLLQHVYDIVPLNEGNIAVAVMSDLSGQSWISTTNQVESSLDRLQKFIRPTQTEGGPRYRFATQEERLIYDETEANEADPDWDAVIDTLDTHLWGEVTRDLSLPESVPYGESGEEYPVAYRFELDGNAFDTTVDAEDGLEVDIAIRGLRPDESSDKTDERALYWEIDTDGLDDLRNRLIEWWALRDAISTRDVPPAVEGDLDERANSIKSKLTAALHSGSYRVKDRTELSSVSTAVQTAVDVTYPDDFHPMLLQVDEDRLRELQTLDGNEPLPAWAQTIQVPAPNGERSSGKQTIQRNVLSLTGRQLKDRDDGLTMQTVLEGITDEKPFYSDARPALCAILWGFCRNGRLVPLDEDGNTLADEAVLDLNRLSTTRLKLLPREPIGKILEEGGFKETTETVADGLISLREANRSIRSTITGLREDVSLVVDADVQSSEVRTLLETFVDELDDRIAETDQRLETIKSQDDSIGDVIEETNRAQDWIAEVSDVWNRRLSALQRLDAILTIRTVEFEWIDADTRNTIESRATDVTSFDGDWWTPDGWSTFSSKLVPDPLPKIERCWETFVDQYELQELVTQIDDHPWVLPPTELPTSVHVAFERTYITPMRRLQQWYDTISNALETLASDPSVDDVVEATDELAAVNSFNTAFDHSPSELETRLSTLSTVVGDRTPEDINGIGIIPDDRGELDRRITRLIEEGDVSTETLDSGVIIR
jgi:energy-coupling factor transporter ATP-binding protein EcfA2